tara:strand:+ start:350 stop:466 length:117 start_codon:yes stop_codon:yes gene_type:complete
LWSLAAAAEEGHIALAAAAVGDSELEIRQLWRLAQLLP